MKKLIILSIIILLVITGKAQLINNNLNIYVGYSLVQPLGNSMFHEGDFITPALFPNFKDAKTISAKVLAAYNPTFSVGIGFNYLDEHNWSFQDYTDYLNSTIRQYSLSPTVQYHTRFKESGIFNHLRFYAEFAPSIQLAQFNTSSTLFVIEDKNGSILPPKHSNDLFFGIKGSGGIEAPLNQYVGIMLSYSFMQSYGSSKLYNDKKYTISQLEMGLYFKFKKIKRLSY